MKRIFFALFIVFVCAAAFANNLPRIAVYVTGEVPDNEKRALGTRMLSTLVNSGRYRGIERSNAFLAEIEREQIRQRSGEIDDSQISALGRQFGIKYVCIADITPAFGSFQVSARIVDVETAEVVYIGDSHSPLSSMDDLTRVASEVVGAMFGRQTAQAHTPTPTQTPTPIPTVPTAPAPTPTPTPTAPAVQRSAPPSSPPPTAPAAQRSAPPPSAANAQQTYTVRINTNPAAGGVVSRNPNQPRYQAGTSVTITAIPQVGYEFSGWTTWPKNREDGFFSTNPVLTNSIISDVNLTAHFSKPGTVNSYWYFTPRWNMLGAFAGYGWWACALELGRSFENGVFVGVDFGGGFFGNYDYDLKYGATIGGTLNIGTVVTSTQNLRISLGGSIGLWVTYATKYDYYDYEDYYTERFGIIGPFIRLNAYNIELSYRLLFGPGNRYDGYSGDASARPVTNHLMLGYQFKWGR